MKISVLINGQAGRANASSIQTAINRALFRASITYFQPSSLEELQIVALREAKTADALIICGGDGTLNAAVQPLMRNREKFPIPPILPLPVGTANDLAQGLGVSMRLEKAARLILETEPKRIDVIEVKSETHTLYMLTNGGFGITAETASLANDVRALVKKHALTAPAFKLAALGLKAVGPKIYELLLAGQMLQGKSSRGLERWHVSIEIDGGIIRESNAPFIMVNNQPGLGGGYVPAPLTSNTDGTFNILLVDSPNLVTQIRALMKIRSGAIPDETICPRLETKRAVVRAGLNSHSLTFFGDGEILQKDVRQVELNCLKRALPVFNGETYS